MELFGLSSRGAAALRPYMDASIRHNVAPGSLGAIVRAYKSAVTKRINILRHTPGAPVWQRNYYDHIIRDEDELGQIRKYITQNPLQLDADRENLVHAPV